MLIRSFGASTTYENATGMIRQRHKSNAEELISNFPVVELNKMTAVCDGGGGDLGHPVEYMHLGTDPPGLPVSCKYCGTRYRHVPKKKTKK